MKNLLLISLLAILFNCSDDKDGNHKDLSGNWKFSKGDISGTIKVTNVNYEYLLVHSASFTINGTKYTDAFEPEIDLDESTFELPGFNLMAADEENYIQFAQGSYNSDYTEITYQLYSFKQECCVQEEFNEPITFKRR